MLRMLFPPQRPWKNFVVMKPSARRPEAHDVAAAAAALKGIEVQLF
jgi:hypothetical protein